jgi:alkylhydroperoxidase family enzyme
MARIDYPNTSLAEIAPLVRRIEIERGKLANLYKMLLHSPPVAEGWLAFLTAIRQKGTLSPRVRELVILRIAVINDAEYEFTAHAPLGVSAGLSQAQVDGLKAGRVEAFDGIDRDIIEYCDSMTRDVHVPDEVFERIRPHFDERELVELTATIGAYNLVSRFLEAMKIDPE